MVWLGYKVSGLICDRQFVCIWEYIHYGTLAPAGPTLKYYDKHNTESTELGKAGQRGLTPVIKNIFIIII